MNAFDDNEEYFESEEVQELMAEIAEEFMDGLPNERELITLTNEDGEEVDFEVLGTVEYSERNFIVLMPTDENENTTVILELIPDIEAGNSTFAPVDDDILYEVFDKFREEHAGEFNFQ